MAAVVMSVFFLFFFYMGENEKKMQSSSPFREAGLIAVTDRDLMF